MEKLWLYSSLSRLRILNYRAKIMVMAFIGTHIPLIAFAAYITLMSTPDWRLFLVAIGITLVATLAGTALTLFVLYQLLQPVILTSAALRRYRESREKTLLPTRFTDEVGVLMADATATIAHLERTRDALEHIDEATGLPNRRKLLQLLQARANSGLSLTLGVVRLANFERIAEVVDTARTDRVAAVLAARLENHAEPGAVVARIGPSDFALLWTRRREDSAVAQNATQHLKVLIEACAETLPLDAIEFKPELLCGVARFPDDATDAEKLLGHALAATAQATPAAPVIPHSTALRSAAFERLTIEHDIRQGIEDAAFSLYYQPVVDLDAGRVIGAEALIRWNHPQRGRILPGDFIPAAEASGLIEPLGVWVLSQACEQLREWNTNGPPNMRMAINVSAQQFLDPKLDSYIAGAIERTGIDPRQIEIELTETSAMADFAHSQRMFARLRELGVSIAIDDFGTGYANISYLRKLPFNHLKIDREFVADVHEKADGQAICRSLITLSQGLNLTILAEGTEKAGEVEYLATAGCRLFQGFFFAKPMPAPEFVQACRTIPAKLAARPH